MPLTTKLIVLVLAHILMFKRTGVNAAQYCLQEPSEDGPIAEVRILAKSWPSSDVTIAVLQILLGELMNVRVTPVLVTNTSTIWWEMIASNVVDADVEVWTEAWDWWGDNVIDLQRLEDGGELGTVARVGWYVPEYVATASPTGLPLDVWSSYKAQSIAQMFHTPNVSDNLGEWSGILPTWGPEGYLLKYLQLPFEPVYYGSSQRLVRYVGARYAQRLPVLFYLYEPHPAFLAFNLRRVLLPPFTDACWANGSTPTCDYRTYYPRKAFAPTLRVRVPEAYFVLSRLFMTNEMQETIMRSYLFNDVPASQAACDWLRSSAGKAQWSNWVPTATQVPNPETSAEPPSSGFGRREAGIVAGSVCGGVLLCLLLVCVVLWFARRRALLRRVRYAPLVDHPHTFVAFADISRAAELWAASPTGCARCIDMYLALARRLLEATRGYEVHCEGDALFVAFNDPIDGLSWCCQLQCKLLELEWPTDILTAAGTERGTTGVALFRGPRVRVGGGVGLVTRRVSSDGTCYEYSGPPVARAARLASVAQGGQTLLDPAVQPFLEDSGAPATSRKLLTLPYTVPASTERLADARELSNSSAATVPLQAIQVVPSQLSGRRFAENGPAPSPSPNRLAVQVELRSKVSEAEYRQLQSASQALHRVWLSHKVLPPWLAAHEREAFSDPTLTDPVHPFSVPAAE